MRRRRTQHTTHVGTSGESKSQGHWEGGWLKPGFSEPKGVLFIFIFAGCWWWHSPTCARPRAVVALRRRTGGREGADLPAWLGRLPGAFVLSAHRVILLQGCRPQVLLPIAPTSRKVAGSLPWALTTCCCSLGSNYLRFPTLSSSSVRYRYSYSYSSDQAPRTSALLVLLPASCFLT